MREMGQSAWLNTSPLTIQASEGRVNAPEAGTGSNSLISCSNNYSVGYSSGEDTEDVRSDRTPLQDHSCTEHCIQRLDIWNLPINRGQPHFGKISIDLRETSTPVKFSDR